MMIDAPTAPVAALAGLAVEDSNLVAGAPETTRWQALGEDLRFFLVCYLAGLIVFLVMLS